MLTLSQVSVRYGSTHALDDVSGSLEPGVTVLLGENGAGKTTLMRVLAGVLTPTSGSLETGRADHASHRAAVGYTPQDVPASRQLSVLRYLQYFGYLRGVPTDALDRQIPELLASVDLVDKKRSRTTALSGGMRRRLGLAVALLGEPSLLLLDEPTAGLDPVQRRDLRRHLVESARGRSVVVSTHLTEDVAALAQQVLVLHRGRVAFHGSIEDFVELGGGGSDRVERAFLAVIGAAP